MHPRSRRTLLAASAVATLALAACGSDEVSAPGAEAAGVNQTATAESAAATATAPAGDAGSGPGLRPNVPVESEDSPLPAITVRDVVDDRWVQFADILPSEQPVLLWFWAPF